MTQSLTHCDRHMFSSWIGPCPQCEAARRTANAILRDCMKRRGIKWAFQEVDDDVLAGILDKWTDLILTEQEPTT